VHHLEDNPVERSNYIAADIPLFPSQLHACISIKKPGFSQCNVLYKMASTFSFGFSGDDIDIDDTEINNVNESVVHGAGAASTAPELVKAKKHDVNDWVRNSSFSGHAKYALVETASTIPEQKSLITQEYNC
jgi:hypothetical protein